MKPYREALGIEIERERQALVGEPSTPGHYKANLIWAARRAKLFADEFYASIAEYLNHLEPLYRGFLEGDQKIDYSAFDPKTFREAREKALKAIATGVLFKSVVDFCEGPGFSRTCSGTAIPDLIRDLRSNDFYRMLLSFEMSGQEIIECFDGIALEVIEEFEKSFRDE